MHQECFILTLLINWQLNAVIFKLNFVSLSSKFKGYIVLLINFKAQKARENLRREKGAEEISLKSFKKTEGC